MSRSNKTDSTTTSLEVARDFTAEPTDLDKALFLLQSEEAKAKLLSTAVERSWASKLVKANEVFQDEVTKMAQGQEFDLAAPVYSLLVSRKIWGKYKAPKGRKDGSAWVLDDHGYMLRTFNHGEMLPEDCDCFQAHAYISSKKLTSTAIENPGTWRPKMGIFFDDLAFPMNIEGYTIFVSAWDLIQGEDLDLLSSGSTISEGAKAYHRKKRSDKFAKIKAELEKDKAKKDLKAAQAEQLRQEKVRQEQLKRERAARDKAVRKALSSIKTEAVQLETLLQSSLASAYLNLTLDQFESLSPEAMDFLDFNSQKCGFQAFLSNWWLDNYDEGKSKTVQLAKAVNDWFPMEVFQVIDSAALLLEIKETLG